jgi:phospholipid/cholesterol/gamma-HCH transport system ATP-binding protein
MAEIISLQNVDVHLGQENVLKNVNLKINKGDVVVIVGPSGAGKTVLLKTMAGIYAPTNGVVKVEGNDWQSLHAFERRKLAQRIGVQFQKSALFDSLNSFDNVAFPIIEHRVLEGDALYTRVKECLDSVGLWKAKDSLPHELSGGMRVRLGMARAMALNPSILFYDDPTAGLDPINSDKMGALILELQKINNSTLIIVTHDLSRAYQLAGRIIMVVAGEVFETGGVKETLSHPDPRVQQFIHGRLEGPIAVSKD